MGSVFDTKVFRPDEKEFQDMAAMLRRIEVDEDCVKSGLAKVSS